jgi:hypothetical protein
MARDPRRRSRMIGRSVQPIVEIARIMEIEGIVEIVEIVDIMRITSSNPQIRRRKDCSIALLA